MDKEKQIEERVELEHIISDAGKDFDNLCEECFESGEYNPFDFAEYLADDILLAGFRKQVEGEWRLEECQTGLFGIDQYFVCSACKQEFVVEGWDYEDLVANAKFCPHCGAKMKGD